MIGTALVATDVPADWPRPAVPWGIWDDSFEPPDNSDDYEPDRWSDDPRLVDLEGDTT